MESSSSFRTEHNLDPNIWGSLPQSMMELILSKLPFAKVIQMRLVCKAWDRVILSLRCAPANPTPKKLLVFTPPGGSLEFISCNLKENALQEWYPSFLSPLVEPTGGLCLMAGGTGFLCFCTKNSGRLLIWNPISKMYRQLPQAHIKDGVNPQDLFKSCHHPNNSTNVVDITMPIHASGRGHVMLTLITHRDTQTFKLFLACNFQNNQTVQAFNSMTSAWKMVTYPLLDSQPRLKFDCAMVLSGSFLYGIVDGELTTDGRRLWNIVRINVWDDHMGDIIAPPHVVVREHHLHTIQKPQLVVYHDNLWLIVEGLLNWTFCFYELRLNGENVRTDDASPWTFVKQISRNLFGGTLVVLHQCIGVEELIYVRVFDIIPDGSAQLVMLVYDVQAESWCFLNDPRGLDGRYFLYHTFVFEPSIDATI